MLVGLISDAGLMKQFLLENLFFLHQAAMIWKIEKNFIRLEESMIYGLQHCETKTI